jgi:hypothetical protein
MQVRLGKGNSTSLPPPISSRIYPGFCNGVGLRLEIVHGQTLQIKEPDRKAMHYLHAPVLTLRTFNQFFLSIEKRKIYFGHWYSSLNST